MRKILAALLALFVLSTAVLAAGHTATTKKQTDIHITETTVRGDPSAAEGLELQITANYDRYLYWQTSYAAGAGPTCETDFRFYNSRQNRSRGMTETLDIQTASLNYGIGGNGIDLEEWENNQEVGRQTMMLKPAIDTASRTSASETRTELLNLRDYYDLFKVQIEVHLSGAIKRDDSWKSAIASYFRFPVPEDLQVSVTVTKDEAGNITDVNVEEVKGEDIYQAYASGVMLQDVFYFVMVNSGEPGLDFSLIPEYGIWALPLHREKENGITTVTYGDLQLVHALDRETAAAQRLTASADGTRLHLITKENGQLYLYILDTQTLMQQNRIALDCEEVPTIWEAENLLVLNYDNHDLQAQKDVIQVLEKQGEEYEPWPELPLYPYVDGYWYGEPVLSYDGRRLAVAVLHDHWLTGSVRLAVYTKEGTAYVGDYHYSGDDIGRDLGTNEEHRLAARWYREG